METPYQVVRARVRQGMLELPPSVVLPEGDALVIALPRLDLLRAEAPLARTAGAWQGLVDTERLLADVSADRQLTSRPAPLFPV